MAPALNRASASTTSRARLVIIGLMLLLVASTFVLFPAFWQGAWYLADGRLVPQLPDNEQYETQADGFLYAGTTGNLIDYHVYYFGAWEGEILNFLRDVHTGSDDAVFMDIGANTGQHSLFMARYSGTVHAIEPYPPVLAIMQQLIERNNADNIRVHAVGFSNENGALPFYAPGEDNLGTGSFDPDFKDSNQQTGELILVIGDEHLAAAGVNRVDSIKIDIEGYERYALQGLRKTLDTSRPVVVMEVNPTEGGFSSREQMDDTFPAEYEYYYLLQGTYPANSRFIDIAGYRYSYGPIVSGDYRLEPFDFIFEGQSNVVAIPAEKTNQLIN